MKYTQEGGRIWLSAEREDHEVVLRVRDTGIGMSPELLPRVFDLFTQGERGLDRSQGGLGIGLTMVRSLVEMHGGSVVGRSDGPGQGSEFIVRLPVLPQTSQRFEQPPKAPKQRGNAPSRRVLVVDDSVSTAETMAALLQMKGHDLRVANDGPKAVEISSRLSARSGAPGHRHAGDEWLSGGEKVATNAGDGTDLTDRTFRIWSGGGPPLFPRSRVSPSPRQTRAAGCCGRTGRVRRRFQVAEIGMCGGTTLRSS